MVESCFRHHAPFEYEYDYLCTEYECRCTECEYDFPDELRVDRRARPGQRPDRPCSGRAYYRPSAAVSDSSSRSTCAVVVYR